VARSRGRTEALARHWSTFFRADVFVRAMGFFGSSNSFTASPNRSCSDCGTESRVDRRAAGHGLAEVAQHRFEENKA
jgi:hypothetical protein